MFYKRRPNHGLRTLPHNPPCQPYNNFGIISQASATDFQAADKRFHRNIFSMYTLWFNKDNELLSEIDVDSMKNFGEYGVLICDTKTFFDRVAIAANTEKSISKMECGFVHYINGKNVMNLTPFIKRADGFSYQNEFRFCADTDNEELLELDTHTSFQDIAIPIRLQEFANTISLKNGLFYFQVDQSNEGNHANS